MAECSLCRAAEMKLEALAKESENRVDISHSSRAMSLPGSKERVLKFELQMYKMRDGEYCIDIQVCRHLQTALSYSQHKRFMRQCSFVRSLLDLIISMFILLICRP